MDGVLEAGAVVELSIHVGVLHTVLSGMTVTGGGRGGATHEQGRESGRLGGWMVAGNDDCPELICEGVYCGKGIGCWRDCVCVRGVYC